MYSISTATWTMKGIVREINNDNISFRCAVQRGYVWDIARQSLFIHTLLKGDIIPPLFIRRFPNDSGRKMEARDGQQRCMTVWRFMTGKFKLAKIPEYNEGDKFDFRISRGENGEEHLESINGLTWDDLTEYEQDRIKDATVKVYYIDNATDAEADLIFFKLNNGKPLSNTELTRAQAKSRDEIKSLCGHELFTKMFNEKMAFNGTFDIVAKMWFMLNEDEPNLMSEHIKKEIKTIIVTPNDITRINKILDFVLTIESLISIPKIAKRVLKKTNFLSLVPIVDLAINEDMNPATFVKFIETFYDGKTTTEPTISDAYNNNFSDASASRSRIRVRHNALMNQYEKQFHGETTDIYSTDREEFEEEEKMAKAEDKKIKEKGLNYDEVIDLTENDMNPPISEKKSEELPELEELEKADKEVTPTIAKTKAVPAKKNVLKSKPSNSKKEKDEVKTWTAAEYNEKLKNEHEAKVKAKLEKMTKEDAPF